MNKKSIRNKNIFKGAALGVALLVCGTALPFSAISSFAATWTQDPSLEEGEVASNKNRIEVDANTVPTTVEKGGEFTIPQGNYFGKSSTAHIIGSEVSGNITESKVVAYYAADGSIVYDSSDEKYNGVTTFDADRVGQYVVKYSVMDSGELYTYELNLRCVVGEVTFEFDANDANIVPSVYDLSIANERDINLPIPTISDENGDELADVEIVIDGEEPTGEDYLLITLDQAYSEDVKVARNSDGGYYIAGSSLTGANGYSFDIVYRYYQNGDLGTRANGTLIDRTHEGDFTYFCETFADIISTKSVNCSEGGLNNYGSIRLAENGEEVTSDILKDKKEQLDSTCALEEVQEAFGNLIISSDGIHYYESGPERTFGSNHEGWDADEKRPVRDNLARAFAPPGEMNPHFKDSNGFDSNYKIFCMDIDEPNEGEIPFGFGIRADGKILNGARADEWMNKSIQNK